MPAFSKHWLSLREMIWIYFANTSLALDLYCDSNALRGVARTANRLGFGAIPPSNISLYPQSQICVFSTSASADPFPCKDNSESSIVTQNVYFLMKTSVLS